MNTLKIRRLRADALLPRYASAGAAGMDLCAALDAPITLQPGERCAVPTGLSLAIPEGFEGQVRARSGLALRHGLALLNAPGTIDSDYRGELKVLLINLGQQPLQLEPGERIAQLVLSRVERLPIEEQQTLDDTARGAGGFGSTGRS